MTKIEKILGVSVLIAIVIAIGAYFYPQVTKVVTQYGSTNTTTNLPSLGLNFISLGQGCQDGFSNNCPQRFTTQRATFSTSVGTTTLCSIQNPFNATTTVNSASIDIQTATTSAYTLAIGTSTDRYTVGTTFVAAQGIASSSLGTQTTVWYPVSGQGVIAPSQYVTFGIVTTATAVNYNSYLFKNMVTGSATTTPAGSCNINFQTVN